MMRAIFLWPVLAMLALPVWADARMTVLVDVLKLQEAAVILRDEGLGYADDLNKEMLNGSGGAGWQIQVDAIYDPARMVEDVRTALEQELSPEQTEKVISFFVTDLGQRIITFENQARRAIAEQDVEDAARARYQSLEGGNDARLNQIIAFAQAGDMIDRNVTSAMNASFQFMRGMVDGDALAMTEEEMLADAAKDVDEITQDTTEWLYGYFLLAYHPLSDAELEIYATFSATPAGEALNRALFAGFGRSYEDISYALGRAVALNMTAQEL